jgi:hypothetical protein
MFLIEILNFVVGCYPYWHTMFMMFIITVSCLFFGRQSTALIVKLF